MLALTSMQIGDVHEVHSQLDRLERFAEEPGLWYIWVDIARWRASLDKWPAVVMRSLEQAADRARIVEERALRAKVLRIGIEIERDQPRGLLALGTVGVSLPLFEQGQREQGTRRVEAALAGGETAAGGNELLALREILSTSSDIFARKSRLGDRDDCAVARRRR